MPEKSDTTDQPQTEAAATKTTAKAPKAVLKYHGAKDGRYLAGVPRRDLMAEDVRSLSAEQRRTITAPGPTGKALYTVTDESAYRAALKRDKE